MSDDTRDLPAKPAHVVGVLDADPLSDGVDTPADRMRNDEGLTPRQAAFVDAYLANGGKKREAAETAGYAPGPGAGVAATRALRLPRVQEAILRRLRQERIEASLPAMRTLAKLSVKAKSEYVRLEAARTVVDGALGEHKAPQVAVHIDIDLS